MLHLTEDLKLGQGTRRVCYLHPEDPSLCVKVSMPKKISYKQQTREAKYYKKLQRRQVSMEHLTPYFGTANSNLGTCYIYQNVVNYDQSPSLSLNKELKLHPEKAPELLAAMHKLLDYLIEELIIHHDVNGSNIHVQYLDADSFKLVIIDGIGETVRIPILNLSKAHVIKTINRRWQRALQKMAKYAPELAPLILGNGA